MTKTKTINTLKQTLAIAITVAMLFSPCLNQKAQAAADELSGPTNSKPALTILNQVSTTLNANISNSDIGALDLTDPTNFPINAKIMIGDEIIHLTNEDSSDATDMTRDQSETGETGNGIAAHSQGDTVYLREQELQFQFKDSGSNTVKSGYDIIITVPEDFYNFGELTYNDLTLSGATAGAITLSEGDVEFNITKKQIIITIPNDLISEELITLKIGGSSKTGLYMPNTPGAYAFALIIRDEQNNVLETGYAILDWANQIKIKATVNEALILNMDTSTIDLLVDPSVDSGEDYSQKTVITGATNALNGYKVKVSLAGSQTPASAQLDNSDGSIVTGDSISTENTFGFIAYNGNGDEFEQAVDTAGRANMNDTVTRTKAQLKSDASAVTAFGTTAEPADLLPVKDDGGGNTPGNTTTTIGFDGPINVSKHTIYYALNVDYLTPAGDYDGVIAYTAYPTF
jgi:hypothetical protein